MNTKELDMSLRIDELTQVSRQQKLKIDLLSEALHRTREELQREIDKHNKLWEKYQQLHDAVKQFTDDVRNQIL